MQYPMPMQAQISRSRRESSSAASSLEGIGIYYYRLSEHLNLSIRVETAWKEPGKSLISPRKRPHCHWHLRNSSFGQLDLDVFALSLPYC